MFDSEKNPACGKLKSIPAGIAEKFLLDKSTTSKALEKWDVSFELVRVIGSEFQINLVFFRKFCCQKDLTNLDYSSGFEN